MSITESMEWTQKQVAIKFLPPIGRQLLYFPEVESTRGLLFPPPPPEEGQEDTKWET
jgi:hypothetical protein